MSLYKDILKKICKIIWKIFIYIFSLVVIGIIAGISFFLMMERSNKPCDERFIHGCMATGLSEEICKDRLY